MLVEHAHVHLARMEIDAAVESSLFAVKPHHVPPAGVWRMSLVADYASAQTTPSLTLVTGLEDSVASTQQAMMSIHAMQRTRDRIGRSGSAKIASR